MKAIIVGGGIGGLTAALMLRARGIGCELFEQSDTIRELGVGINTLPHAIRELAGLGLLQKLDDVAIRTDVLYYLNPVSYTHLRAHETVLDLVCRLLLEKKK